MICAERIAVIAQVRISGADAADVIVLEVSRPGVGPIQINRVTAAPIHRLICPEIVSFRVAVDVRIGNAVARKGIGQGGGLLSCSPSPAPQGVCVLLVLDRRYRIAAPRRTRLPQCRRGTEAETDEQSACKYRSHYEL